MEKWEPEFLADSPHARTGGWAAPTPALNPMSPDPVLLSVLSVLSSSCGLRLSEVAMVPFRVALEEQQMSPYRAINSGVP